MGRKAPTVPLRVLHVRRSRATSQEPQLQAPGGNKPLRPAVARAVCVRLRDGTRGRLPVGNGDSPPPRTRPRQICCVTVPNGPICSPLVVTVLSHAAADPGHWVTTPMGFS